MAISITLMLHFVNITAQESPPTNGEFNLELYSKKGAFIDFPVKIFSASTVWGSKDVGDGYEITTDFTNLFDANLIVSN